MLTSLLKIAIFILEIPSTQREIMKQFAKTALAVGSALALTFTLSCSGDSSNGSSDSGCTIQQSANGYDVLCDGVNVGKLGNCEVHPMVDKCFEIQCNNETKGTLCNGTNGSDGKGCSIVTDSTNSAYYFITCGGIAQSDWRIAKAWCGTVAYDPETHFCENPSLGTLKQIKTDDAFPTGTPPTIYMLNLQPGSTNSELRFNWYSLAGTTSKVRVFKGKYLVTTGEATPISGTCSGDYCGSVGASHKYHKVAVTGLEPNTEYTYSVSNDGTNWTAEKNYRTPPSGAFRFAATSDVQPSCTSAEDDQCKNNTLWSNIVKRIANSGASLIINAGDLAYNGREIEYEALLGPLQLQEIPFAPVMGNHDHNHNGDFINFDNHFNLPNRVGVIPITTTTQQYHGNSNYFFLYNRVLFIGLNTSDNNKNVSENNIKEWIVKFKATIDSAKTVFSPIMYDFIVVTHHKSTNSISNGSGAHPLNGDVKNLVAAGFQQMMTAYGVDLVFAGHDHIYVRSQIIYNDRKSTKANGNNTGTLYITLKPSGYPDPYQTGIAGIASSTSGFTTSSYPYLIKIAEETYKSCPSNTSSDYDTNNYLPESYACHSIYTQGFPGYTMVEVNGTRMNINVYEYDGSLFETYTLSPTLPKFAN